MVEISRISVRIKDKIEKAKCVKYIIRRWGNAWMLIMKLLYLIKDYHF